MFKLSKKDKDRLEAGEKLPFCARCGQEFDKPIIFETMLGKMEGKTLIAYDEDSCLCTDCDDEEVEENERVVRE